MKNQRIIWEEQIGTIPDKDNSVKQIRKLRERLSKEKFDLKEINKLAD